MARPRSYFELFYLTDPTYRPEHSWVIDERKDDHAVGALGEGDLAHLLFRGFDAVGKERLGAREDASLLQMLFPAQDLVVWRADAF